ncbi:ISAs1 family transposase [Aeromonas media]|uniref:ISAs1 family transposase n=1 Tax=Aeromonas media TaxID=651 RepID=UPI00384EBDBC
MSIDAVFAQFFDNIHDPRQHAKIYYPFYDVLFLTVCAVIGGAEGWEDIEDFGEVHLPWFQSKGLFKKTAFLSMTPLPGSSPASNQSRFRPPLCGGLKPLTSTPMAPWSLSMAKTLRSSYDREDRTSTIHMVSAYAAANKLVLGQIKKPTPSPMKLPLFPSCWRCSTSKGCLVSIDAMGCQTEIAETILQQGGDYLLAVKGNQPKLFEAVRQAPRPAGGHPVMRRDDDA